MNYGHFPSHLVRAYGTPANPKKPPMGKVFLAPAVNDPPLQSVPDDQVGEPFDAIQKKQAAARSDYEKLPRSSIQNSMERKENGRPKSRNTT